MIESDCLVGFAFQVAGKIKFLCLAYCSSGLYGLVLVRWVVAVVGYKEEVCCGARQT